MYAFLPSELMLCVAKQMSKTIKKLEKENFSLKKKCEKSDVTIIELLDEVCFASIPSELLFVVAFP